MGGREGEREMVEVEKNKKRMERKCAHAMSAQHAPPLTFHAVARSPGGLSGRPPLRARARKLARSTAWPGAAVAGDAMSAANRAARSAYVGGGGGAGGWPGGGGAGAAGGGAGAGAGIVLAAAAAAPSGSAKEASIFFLLQRGGV